MEDNDIGKAIPNQHLRRNRERFSTPHTARDPNKVEEVELESENLQGMIRHPPKVVAVWFHHEPESINTSHAGVTATILERKHALARRVSPPLPSSSMHVEERSQRGAYDKSPVIVNWSVLDPSEQAEITPTLASTDNWIILTHPLGPEKTITPPIPAGAQRILHSKGKPSRERGWWRTGTDKLASYGLDTEVWISQDSTIPNASIPALEELLQTKCDKDLPDMRSDGVKSISWAGTESGLMDIYNFPGVIYATDGSKGSTRMGPGFYQHNTKGGDCCRVGGGTRGGLSGRAKFAAACLALEDSLTHDQPIAVLTDSEGFMTVSSNWGSGRARLFFVIPRMVTYLLVSSRFFIKEWISDSSLSSFKSELTGESFSTRRLADGPTKGETKSAMYDGMAPIHIPPSHGRRLESSTDAP